MRLKFWNHFFPILVRLLILRSSFVQNCISYLDIYNSLLKAKLITINIHFVSLLLKSDLFNGFISLENRDSFYLVVKTVKYTAEEDRRMDQLKGYFKDKGDKINKSNSSNNSWNNDYSSYNSRRHIIYFLFLRLKLLSSILYFFSFFSLSLS